MGKFQVLNPYDQSLVGEFDFHSAEQVQKMITALDVGKEKQKELTNYERSIHLNKLADLLIENKKELAEIITKEVGKTISDSLVEIDRSSNTARASADACRQISGEALFSDNYPPKRDRLGIVLRKPIGNVLAITPFNFPINLSLHKIGPSYAAGNCTLIKPGPQNYFSVKLLVELCHQAGIPKEALQFFCPDIPELNTVIQSKHLQCISFTGGTRTADLIAKNAGRKKLLLELGGNDPLIVMPDADIDKAASTVVNQRFATAGQRCTASKRLFIHTDVYDEFKKCLVIKSKDLVIGDPMDKNTFVGPVVNKVAANQIESRIKNAIANGANCLLGNKREGNIIYPTILENVEENEELIKDETFGPVAPLIKFDNLEKLIEQINSTDFGLQAGVFTNDITLIKRLYEDLEVGSLAVNDGPGFRAEHFPFGGIKDSGLGREGILYAMEEMSVVKSLIL